MSELALDRSAVQAALSAFLLHGWLWETDAGASPEPIRSTYLAEVEACDIYIGLFGTATASTPSRNSITLANIRNPASSMKNMSRWRNATRDYGHSSITCKT